jgi:hypothetical protein
MRGSCLCGAVHYEVRLPFSSFVNCHCSRCCKATGSAYAANAIVAPDAFRRIRGEENVQRYDLPEGRSFATAFCRRCGSPLPHPTSSGREVILPASSFDEDPGDKPSAQVFWESRAAWFEPQHKPTASV